MHSVCIVTVIQTQSKYQSKIMGEKYMYVRETEKERGRKRERRRLRMEVSAGQRQIVPFMEGKTIVC